MIEVESTVAMDKYSLVIIGKHKHTHTHTHAHARARARARAHAHAPLARTHTHAHAHLSTLKCSPFHYFAVVRCTTIITTSETHMFITVFILIHISKT